MTLDSIRNSCDVLHISSHVVRKKTAQVIYSSTVASSEVQEQVEVGDDVRVSSQRDQVRAEMCSLEISIEWKILISDIVIRNLALIKKKFHILYNVGPVS